MEKPCNSAQNSKPIKCSSTPQIFIRYLGAALNDKNYDFSKILSQAPGYYCSLPWGGVIWRTAVFFEEIYSLTNQWWKDDLEKASLEDPSTW